MNLKHWLIYLAFLLAVSTVTNYWLGIQVANYLREEAACEQNVSR